MAKDIRGLGRVSVSSVIDTSATGNPITTFPENIRGGGIANYTDSERTNLDGRIIDNNMLIFNTDQGYYERYVGGTRDASGFMSGGAWEQLRFSGSAIDSDDTDAIDNHTRGIRTGRGLEVFDVDDSDVLLESRGGKAIFFDAVRERDENTSIVWTRGDMALIRGLDWFDALSGGGQNVSPYRIPGTGGNPDRIVIGGLTQDLFNRINNSDPIVIGTSNRGANRLTLTRSTEPFVPGAGGYLVGAIDNQGRWTVEQGDATGYGENTNNNAILAFLLVEDSDDHLGGTYVFTTNTDQNGPTLDGQWQRLLPSASLRNDLITEFTTGIQGIQTLLESNVNNLQSEIDHRSSADTETNLRVDGVISRFDTETDNLSARDTELATMITDLGTRLDQRVDSDNDSLAQEIIDRIASDDSDALGIRSNNEQIQNIRDGNHFRRGLYIELTRTDSDSDTINVDTDTLRIKGVNLEGFMNTPTPGTQDTDRIVISGNINTASAQVFNPTQNTITGFDTDGSIGRRNAAYDLFDPVRESNVNINGTYIRDPVSNKILRITDDRPTDGTQFAELLGILNDTGGGATVIETPHGYHSYWLPGGGGFPEGLSLVATNDLGQFTLANNDAPDSDLPLNWRIIRGRWFSDDEYVVGQNFNGIPLGTTAAPICTYNLFGDSDAKRNSPIGTIRDSELQLLSMVSGVDTEFQARVVGGGVAAYPSLFSGTEFFQEIFDDTFGATRAYVDSRLTEQGITNLVGNTETLVTYENELSSFPRPPDNSILPGAEPLGEQLPQNTFVLSTGTYPSPGRQGRYASNTNASAALRYRGSDLPHGGALDTVTHMYIRGDSTIFRNIMLKMEEDSVLQFTDSDGNNKFYWEIQDAAQQDFNENIFLVRRKNLKYAQGTFDTDANYDVYIKPGVNDLLPGTQIIPESLQPLSLHLASGETLVDGQNVVVRRQGDIFLFAIEEGGGGGGSGGGQTRAEVNNLVNTLDMRFVDSENRYYVELYGNTTVDTAEVAGTAARVQVAFNSDPTGTTIMTFAPPAGDSESLTSTATTAAGIVGDVRDYLRDNVIGRTLATNVSLFGTTIAWTWNAVGITDSDSDEGFFYTNNDTLRHVNTIVTQGTDTVPATYREGLIDTVQIPRGELSSSTGFIRNIFTDSEIEDPLSVALTLHHTLDEDSEVIVFQDSPRIFWSTNPDTNPPTITPDIVAGSIDSEKADTDQIVTHAQLAREIGDHSFVLNANVFTADSDGLVPRSGSSADSDFYLAGDATWRTVPRSRITFQDHEIDASSDLFRIDYDADSETLTFSASAVDSEQMRPVDWDGNIAYIPSVSNPSIGLIGLHLIQGPTYTITDTAPTRLGHGPDSDFAWRGTFTNFQVQEQFNRIVVAYSDIDTDSDFGRARIPLPLTDSIINSSNGSLSSILPPTAPISSVIPIIASHFDSEGHGLVPASDSDDTDVSVLGGDAVWRDGRTIFGSVHTQNHTEDEIANLKTYSYTHVLGRDWTADSDTIAPRDFRFINFDSTGITIGVLPGYDAQYAGFVQGIIPSINHGGLWSLEFDFTYYDPPTDSFIHRFVFVNTTGTDLVYDTDADTLFIGTPADSIFGNNVRVVYSNGNGDALSTPSAGTITNGYWNKWVLYGDASTNGRPVISTSDIRAFGDIQFQYSVEDSVPSFPTFIRTEARKATFGTGIDYDTDTNQVNLNLDLGTQQGNGFVEVPTPTPINRLNFYGTTIGNQQGNEIDIRVTPVPTRYSSTATFFPDQLIFDESNFSLYKVIQVPSGLLPSTPPITDTDHFLRLTVPVGTVAAGSVSLTPTELINAASQPQQLVDYDTDGLTDWVQYVNWNAGNLHDYTIFYLYTNNQVGAAHVYTGHHTSLVGAGSPVASRTYTRNGGKTLWTDSGPGHVI